MSLDSAFEFLASQELLVICTASKDGVPHAAPSFYALDGHDILFTTSGSSRTGTNLLSNPVAAVAAGDAPDPGQSWDEAKGIQIQAKVTALEGDDATAAADKLKAAYSHLGDGILQSHFFRLTPTSIDYI
ncbi:MAG: Pyridoxamine 5-phosphate oxidase, partial [Ilumatobacteraceae bacterium]|nr:Pyridoxamine 5-phosphate oxidase [Ilumatobacteraceae bacterium]